MEITSMVILVCVVVIVILIILLINKREREDQITKQREYIHAIRAELRPLYNDFKQNLKDMFETIDKHLEKIE
ncbi:MAG: hypothetical protein JSW08_03110 [archaeon]|nr:MAG: hypothetical protein JSW08_03110 [archaeon]